MNAQTARKQTEEAIDRWELSKPESASLVNTIDRLIDEASRKKLRHIYVDPLSESIIRYYRQQGFDVKLHSDISSIKISWE